MYTIDRLSGHCEHTQTHSLRCCTDHGARQSPRRALAARPPAPRCSQPPEPQPPLLAMRAATTCIPPPYSLPYSSDGAGAASDADAPADAPVDADEPEPAPAPSEE